MHLLFSVLSTFIFTVGIGAYFLIPKLINLAVQINDLEYEKAELEQEVAELTVELINRETLTLKGNTRGQLFISHTLN